MNNTQNKIPVPHKTLAWANERIASAEEVISDSTYGHYDSEKHGASHEMFLIQKKLGELRCIEYSSSLKYLKQLVEYVNSDYNDMVLIGEMLYKETIHGALIYNREQVEKEKEHIKLVKSGKVKSFCSTITSGEYEIDVENPEKTGNVVPLEDMVGQFDKLQSYLNLLEEIRDEFISYADQRIVGDKRPLWNR